MMDDYLYSRRLCDPLTETIRLLDLLPAASAGSPVQCRLRYIDLGLVEAAGAALASGGPGDEYYYEAISYCWGGQSRTSEISCDGRRMWVTANLHSALVTFRRTDIVVSVWADAVCIDQADAQEKSIQVPLMWKIYRGAGAVRIWLGDDEMGDSVGAFAMLRNMQTVARAIMPGRGTEAEELGYYRFRDVVWTSNVLSEHEALRHGIQPHDPRWASVARLLQNPWFRRIWIVQEVAMARHPPWVCWGSRRGGNDGVSWTVVEQGIVGWLFSGVLGLMGFLDLERDRASLTSGALEHTIALLDTITHFRQRNRRPCVNTNTPSNSDQAPMQPIPLFTLLLRHRITQATDPRDKVYALLNLARYYDGHHVALPLLVDPDYSLDTSSVYRAVALRLLETMPTLALLCLRPAPPERDATSTAGLKLPSWVPDWSASGRLESGQSLAELTLVGGDEGGENATPTWDAARTQEFPKMFSAGGNVLSVQGMVLDEIVEISTSALQTDSLGAQWLPIEQQKRRECTHFVGCANLYGHFLTVAHGRSPSSPYTATGESIYDAFVSMLRDGHPEWPSTDGLDASVNGGRGWSGSLIRYVLAWGRPVYYATKLVPRNWPAATARVARAAGNARMFFSRLATLRVTVRTSRDGPDLKTLREPKRPSILTHRDAMPWVAKMLKTSDDYLFFRTRTGYMGRTTNRCVRPGDVVAIIRGCPIPLVLQGVAQQTSSPASAPRNASTAVSGSKDVGPAAQVREWQLAGDCYLHGAMFGDLFEADRCTTLHIV